MSTKGKNDEAAAEKNTNSNLANFLDHLPGANQIVRAAQWYHDQMAMMGSPLSPSKGGLNNEDGQAKSFSGLPDFEFLPLDSDNDKTAVVVWFDHDAVAAAPFYPFAQCSNGGVFAFWKCYDNVDSKNAPYTTTTTTSTVVVVYLASECQGSRVVARTASELLSIVAFGSDLYESDIAGMKEDPEEEEEEWTGPEDQEDNTSIQAFRLWLQAELGIAPAVSPVKTIQAAMAQSPDLMEYVRNWSEGREDEKNKMAKRQKVSEQQ